MDDEPLADGILVRITHDFRPRWGPLSGWPAQRIIGEGFVGTIAGRTLRCVKATAEAAQRVGSGQWSVASDWRLGISD